MSNSDYSLIFEKCKALTRKCTGIYILVTIKNNSRNLRKRWVEWISIKLSYLKLDLHFLETLTFGVVCEYLFILCVKLYCERSFKVRKSPSYLFVFWVYPKISRFHRKCRRKRSKMFLFRWFYLVTRNKIGRTLHGYA